MKAKRNARDFPIVCVGGSAGGLDAYTRLLGHLPADMGVAIVIVNHLRTVATRLHEILPRFTLPPGGNARRCSATRSIWRRSSISSASRATTADACKSFAGLFGCSRLMAGWNSNAPRALHL